MNRVLPREGGGTRDQLFLRARQMNALRAIMFLARSGDAQNQVGWLSKGGSARSTSSLRNHHPFWWATARLIKIYLLFSIYYINRLKYRVPSVGEYLRPGFGSGSGLGLGLGPLGCGGLREYHHFGMGTVVVAPFFAIGLLPFSPRALVPPVRMMVVGDDDDDGRQPRACGRFR